MPSESSLPPTPPARANIEPLPINEKICLLQNYGLPRPENSGSSVTTEGNNNGTENIDQMKARVFYYNIDVIEGNAGDPREEDGNTTPRGQDQYIEVALHPERASVDFSQIWPREVAVREEDEVAVGEAVGEEDEVAVGEEDEVAVGEESEIAVDEEGEIAVDEEGEVAVREDGEVVVGEEEAYLHVADFSDRYNAAKFFLPRAEGKIREKLRGKDYYKKTLAEQQEWDGVVTEKMEDLSTTLDAEKLPTLKPSAPVFFSALEQEQILVLGVSLPYLDISGAHDRQGGALESCSLSEYMRLKMDRPIVSRVEDTQKKEARVYTALFMIIGNDMVAVFRSKDNKHSDRPPPLFRGQERLSTYHALVPMISNILQCPQKKLIKFFNDEISQKVSDTEDRMSGLKSPSRMNSVSTGSTMVGGVTKELDTDELDNILLLDLQGLVADISALRKVVKSQIEILEELRDVYESTFSAKKIRNKNLVKIPIIWGMGERLRPTLDTIDKVIEERKKFDKKADDWVKELRTSHKSLSKFLERRLVILIKNAIPEEINRQGGVIKGSITKQTEVIEKSITDQTQEIIGSINHQTTETTQTQSKELEAHAGAMKQQRNIMIKQQRAMSALMFVSMVFLPLGFFASYLGMNGGWTHRPISEHTIFWAIGAPITLAIGVVICLVDRVFEDWPKKFRKWRKRVGLSTGGHANTTPSP